MSFCKQNTSFMYNLSFGSPTVQPQSSLRVTSGMLKLTEWYIYADFHDKMIFVMEVKKMLQKGEGWCYNSLRGKHTATIMHKDSTLFCVLQ